MRLRWPVLAAWAAAGAALAWWVPPVDPGANEQTTFLPAWAPSRHATEAMAGSFPGRSGLSEAVVVFERRSGPLSEADLDAVEEVARRIPLPRPPLGEKDLEGLTVRSPQSLGLPKSPLVSEDGREGQAALILVAVPANFITIRSARIVDHIDSILQEVHLPEGLRAAVTGASGFGHDYALAAERSHARTFRVTLIAVVVILLVVYRAAAAAAIPLGAISLAVLVALKILDLTSRFGLQSGTAEKIFVVVLVYGAGVDYSLLLMSRCREFLDARTPPLLAAEAGLGGTFGAILAAAGTNICGLLMLTFAEYGIFHTTGPAVAIALVVAAGASVTLVPALVGIAGRWLFWPGLHGRRAGRGWPWPALARLVTRRPGVVLAASLALLAFPAVQGTRLNWVYDTLASLSEDYAAARGASMAKRHWPIGEIGPLNLLIQADRPLDAEGWNQLSRQISQALAKVKDVSDVRALTQPLGGRVSAATNRLIRRFAQEQVRAEYLSADARSLRMNVVLDKPALTLDAMEALRNVRQTAQGAVSAAPAFAKGAPNHARVLVAGATAEMADIRAVTRRDFHRIAGLVLGVILLIVLMLLRDAVLSAFMVASTVLSYLATLGLSYWFFVGLSHQAGLDWKVEVFLFVVMVAVGQDYNIFLAARLAEEARGRGPREATHEALVHTGPVISSCGIIMAATLGSLMVGDLTLLVQLGFALSLGMLIDTFLVRPLLLPAFVVLTGRTGRAGKVKTR